MRSANDIKQFWHRGQPYYLTADGGYEVEMPGWEMYAHWDRDTVIWFIDDLLDGNTEEWEQK